MKKIFLTITLFMAALMILTSCNNKQTTIEDQFDNETYNVSYQALSSIKLLEAKDKFSEIKKMNAFTSEISLAEKEVIDRYMDLMNEVLNDNGGFKTILKASDKQEYQTLLEITTRDIDGSQIVYSLYYNETLVSEETEIDDDDPEDVETKTIKKLSGIAVTGEKTFTLEGITEEEVENNETETKSKFKILEDKDNYVIVEEEKETETNEYEHTYSYTVVAGGKKVSEVEFEIEQEDGELVIEIKEKSIDNKKTYKFKEITDNNNKYYKIEVKNGKEVTKIKVRAVLDTETNKYMYLYSYMDNNK